MGKCGFIGFVGVVYSPCSNYRNSSHVGQLDESSDTILKLLFHVFETNYFGHFLVLFYMLKLSPTVVSIFDFWLTQSHTIDMLYKANQGTSSPSFLSKGMVVSHDFLIGSFGKLSCNGDHLEFLIDTKKGCLVDHNPRNVLASLIKFGKNLKVKYMAMDSFISNILKLILKGHGQVINTP